MKLAADKPRQVIRGNDADHCDRFLYNQALLSLVHVFDSDLRHRLVRAQLHSSEARRIFWPTLFGGYHLPDQQQGRRVMVHQRLLLLSCSQRKRPDPEPLPAIDRYDGPFFRVLRRYQRGYSSTTPQSMPLPDIYILSAEYGLISADQPIVNYERRMTALRADELRPRVLAELLNLLGPNTSYQELFLCMGREYRRTLEDSEMLWPKRLTVAEAEGSMGGRQAQLHDWLYGVAPAVPSTTYHGVPRIRGVEVNLTTQQVLDVARQALSRNEKNAASFENWYVQLDDRRVAPKWLVSQLTGLPVSAFATGDARRLLAQLGIEVKRA